MMFLIRLIKIFFIFSSFYVADLHAIDHYKDSIFFGNYIKNMQQTFEKSVKRNGWALTKIDDNKYMASIFHKSYDIKVELLIKDKSVRLVLQSATRPDCTRRCKVDMDKVEGWLVRLRKSLALDITYLVRDDALAKSIR